MTTLRSNIGVPSLVTNIGLLFSYFAPAFNLASISLRRCSVSQRTTEAGNGIVRRLFGVFGSPKYQPPPFRQTMVRCTVAVPFAKSKSFHCRPKYSSGRIPVESARPNKAPCSSSNAAARKRGFFGRESLHFFALPSRQIDRAARIQRKHVPLHGLLHRRRQDSMQHPHSSGREAANVTQLAVKLLDVERPHIRKFSLAKLRPDIASQQKFVVIIGCLTYTLLDGRREARI